MKSTRRHFLTKAGAAGLASPLLAVTAHGAEVTDRVRQPDAEARQARLRDVLRQPVLKKELFKSPVIIESLELLRWENSFLCRVRSTDGAEGISVAHSGMRTLHPIFLHNLQPFFVGKDIRELDLILDRVVLRHYSVVADSVGLRVQEVRRLTCPLSGPPAMLVACFAWLKH